MHDVGTTLDKGDIPFLAEVFHKIRIGIAFAATQIVIKMGTHQLKALLQGHQAEHIQHTHRVSPARNGGDYGMYAIKHFILFYCLLNLIDHDVSYPS